MKLRATPKRKLALANYQAAQAAMAQAKQDMEAAKARIVELAKDCPVGEEVTIGNCTFKRIHVTMRERVLPPCEFERYFVKGVV